MDTSTQTLIRLIQSAEVKKNIEDEAKRLADIKARNVEVMRLISNVEGM